MDGNIKHVHLAPPGANTCDYGSSLKESECETAVQTFAKEAGKTPGRRMVLGSGGPWGSCEDGGWIQVPFYCSVQSGGDWTAHYKKCYVDIKKYHDDTVCIRKPALANYHASCIHKDYQLVCSGMLNFLLYVYL